MADVNGQAAELVYGPAGQLVFKCDNVIWRLYLRQLGMAPHDWYVSRQAGARRESQGAQMLNLQGGCDGFAATLAGRSGGPISIGVTHAELEAELARVETLYAEYPGWLVLVPVWRKLNDRRKDRPALGPAKSVETVALRQLDQAQLAVQNAEKGARNAQLALQNAQRGVEKANLALANARVGLERADARCAGVFPNWQGYQARPNPSTTPSCTPPRATPSPTPSQTPSSTPEGQP